LYWTFSCIPLYIACSSLYHNVSFLLDRSCPSSFIKWSFLSFFLRDLYIGFFSFDVTFLLRFLRFAVLLLQRYPVHTQPPRFFSFIYYYIFSRSVSQRVHRFTFLVGLCISP
jgi:hypothetical protein